jgi:hypothetical protein
LPPVISLVMLSPLMLMPEPGIDAVIAPDGVKLSCSAIPSTSVWPVGVVTTMLSLELTKVWTFICCASCCTAWSR